MFGIGTISTIIICSIMGPTITLCILAIAAAYVSSVVVTMSKANLSDATLEQDITHIKRAFDTDAILSTTPAKMKCNKLLTRIARTLIGHHIRLEAKPPVHLSMPLQMMRIASIVGNVHAKAVASKTKVLEITINSGHCTHTLANIMPAAEFEFHIFDTEATAQSSSTCPNIHVGNNISTWPTFDVIFAVESVHIVSSIDRLRDFMAKTSEHLAPHGRLVIIDCFRSETFANATPHQQLATRLAERAFGVKELHPMSMWIECAHRAGLRLHRLDDLTTQTQLFWTIGWRVAHSVLVHAPAWLVRRLHAAPYTMPATNSLLEFVTGAHAMRNRTAAVYGVVEFSKME